jgi:hypothetical protein
MCAGAQCNYEGTYMIHRSKSLMEPFDFILSQIVKRRTTNEANSLEVVRDVRNKLTPEVLSKYVERIPQLIEVVIEAQGGYFDEKYAPRKFKHQLVYH